jgi:hypothetical protein
VTALRTLEKLGRPANDDSYPVDDDGRFFVGGRSEPWDLYRCNSDETRERWRREWQPERGRRVRRPGRMARTCRPC